MSQRPERTKYVPRKSPGPAIRPLQVKNTPTSKVTSRKSSTSTQNTKSMMPFALLTNIAKKGTKEPQRVSSVPSPVAPIPLRKEDDPLQAALQKIAALEARLAGNSITKERGSKSHPTPHLRILQVVLGLGHMSGRWVSSLFSFLIDRTSSTDI